MRCLSCNKPIVSDHELCKQCYKISRLAARDEVEVHYELPVGTFFDVEESTIWDDNEDDFYNFEHFDFDE